MTDRSKLSTPGGASRYRQARSAMQSLLAGVAMWAVISTAARAKDTGDDSPYYERPTPPPTAEALQELIDAHLTRLISDEQKSEAKAEKDATDARDGEKAEAEAAWQKSIDDGSCKGVVGDSCDTILKSKLLAADVKYLYRKKTLFPFLNKLTAYINNYGSELTQKDPPPKVVVDTHPELPVLGDPADAASLRKLPALPNDPAGLAGAFGEEKPSTITKPQTPPGNLSPLSPPPPPPPAAPQAAWGSEAPAVVTTAPQATWSTYTPPAAVTQAVWGADSGAAPGPMQASWGAAPAPPTAAEPEPAPPEADAEPEQQATYTAPAVQSDAVSEQASNDDDSSDNSTAEASSDEAESLLSGFKDALSRVQDDAALVQSLRRPSGGGSSPAPSGRAPSHDSSVTCPGENGRPKAC